jgi:N-acetylglucosamine kinase-like BadF-type ATPase
MNERRYVIGIDGGGTKTDCLLTELNGRGLSYGKAGGANHQIDASRRR